MSSNKQSPPTFGIVCPMTVELDALLIMLKDYERISYAEKDNRTYYRAFVPLPSGKFYQIVITVLPRMGNLEAALAANDLLQRWDPHYLLVTGIAAGTNLKVQNFGDIVIGESILYYEIAKRGEGNESVRPRMLPADVSLYDRAINFKPQSILEKIINTGKIDDSLRNEPAIHFGTIASGEKVVANIEEVNRLLKIHPKLVGIEMESAGIASAALSAAKRVGFLTIRAISDFADANKDDKWRIFAAMAAAAWTLDFVTSDPFPELTVSEETKNLISSWGSKKIQPNTKQIFISYERHTDETYARHLSRNLEQWGFSCLSDLDFVENLKTETIILQSDAVIGIISSESLANKEVRRAWDFALSRNKDLFLVKVSKDIDVPSIYGSLQIVDLSIDESKAWSDLQAVLASNVPHIISSLVELTLSQRQFIEDICSEVGSDDFDTKFHFEKVGNKMNINVKGKKLETSISDSSLLQLAQLGLINLYVKDNYIVLNNKINDIF